MLIIVYILYYMYILYIIYIYILYIFLYIYIPFVYIILYYVIFSSQESTIIMSYCILLLSIAVATQANVYLPSIKVIMENPGYKKVDELK